MATTTWRPSMTATFDIVHTRRELDHRSSNGIDVYLLWSPADSSLTVAVIDGEDSFELAAAPSEALDVFHHPFAYAPPRRTTLLDVPA
jgi:hypothetical protein